MFMWLNVLDLSKYITYNIQVVCYIPRIMYQAYFHKFTSRACVLLSVPHIYENSAMEPYSTSVTLHELYLFAHKLVSLANLDADAFLFIVLSSICKCAAHTHTHTHSLMNVYSTQHKHRYIGST